MKIVIAGGTGFLGSPLAEMYAEDGHDVRVLTRVAPIRRDAARPGHRRPRHHARRLEGRRRQRAVGRPSLEGADARHQPFGRVAGCRNAGRSRRRSSSGTAASWRREASRRQSEAAASPPAVLISGSAVGFYGPSDDRALTETRSAPAPISSRSSASIGNTRRIKPSARGTRVVLLRTGVVLERSGGALPEMMRPFKFFAGGPIGSGRQYVSWIHRLDWIEIVRWIVQTPAVSGPVNATAPHPVTNRHLSRALGRAMHRPEPDAGAGLRVKIVLGEFADHACSPASACCPARAQKDGYHFRYPEIEQAFRGIFGD